ncbi:hypothetical protein ACJX0J_003590 [Zea mays]
MKVQERILNLVGGFKLKYNRKNMGQKINPLGFRLGTTQNHHSFWKIKKYGISEVITHIEIQKEIDTIHKKGAIEELEKDLQKEVNSVNQRLNIAIEKVKEPYRQPNILAEYIAFQLKNRGIKIQIAGLLGVKIWIFNLVFPKNP